MHSFRERERYYEKGFINPGANCSNRGSVLFVCFGVGVGVIMKKIKSTILAAVAALLTISLSFTAGYFYRDYKGEAEPVETPSSTSFDLRLPAEVEKRIVTKEEIELKLVEIGQFATYSAEYDVEKSANYTRYFLDDIPVLGTTNKVNIQCSGIVKLGYQVEDIVPTIDNESMKIYIAIPEPQVLDNYIIWESVKCEEINNILNPIDFDQYQTLIGEIEQLGLEKATDEGIYEAASENVQILITNFLAVFEDYDVVFL